MKNFDLTNFFRTVADLDGIKKYSKLMVNF